MAKKKTVIRKYRYPSLTAYFAHQRKQYDGPGGSRYTTTDESLDTHARLAERMGVSETTISRIAAKLNDPSYELALKISRDIDCPPDTMGRSGVA
jgi:transcriptional regulator with XRE-family HTH domain